MIIDGRQARHLDRRAATRRRLLEAGLVVIAERGVGAATVGEVSGRAGVVPGTFYNYFQTKDDLVAAIVDEMAASIRLSGDALRSLEGDPAGRVALAALALMARAEHEAGFGRAFAELVRLVPALSERLRALVEATIAEGVTRGRFRAEALAATAAAVLDITAGAVHAVASGRPHAPTPDHLAAMLLALLGLGRAEAESVLLVARRAHHDAAALHARPAPDVVSAPPV